MTFSLAVVTVCFTIMPKKKTGQRKKADKQKERQKSIRRAQEERPLVNRPCNASMASVAACLTVPRPSSRGRGVAVAVAVAVGLALGSQ